MDEKLKALSKEDQHTFSRVVSKLACVARKFDSHLLKKKPGRRELDSKAAYGGGPTSGPAHSSETQPSQFVPHPRPQLKLGIVRLDYNYEPAPGDIDYPKSFKYKVSPLLATPEVANKKKSSDP